MLHLAEETAQQVKGTCYSHKDLSLITSTHMVSHNVTSSSGIQCLFFGLHRNQAHMWYTHIHVEKTHIHIGIKSLKFTNEITLLKKDDVRLSILYFSRAWFPPWHVCCLTLHTFYFCACLQDYVRRWRTPHTPAVQSLCTSSVTITLATFLKVNKCAFLLMKKINIRKIEY